MSLLGLSPIHLLGPHLSLHPKVTEPPLSLHPHPFLQAEMKKSPFGSRCRVFPCPTPQAAPVNPKSQGLGNWGSDPHQGGFGPTDPGGDGTRAAGAVGWLGGVSGTTIPTTTLLTPPHQPANKELAAPVAQHPLTLGETEARRHRSQSPAMRHRQGCGRGKPQELGHFGILQHPVPMTPQHPPHLCSLQPLSPHHTSWSRASSGNTVDAPNQHIWGVSPQHATPQAPGHSDSPNRMATSGSPHPCPARYGCSLHPQHFAVVGIAAGGGEELPPAPRLLSGGML